MSYWNVNKKQALKGLFAEHQCMTKSYYANTEHDSVVVPWLIPLSHAFLLVINCDRYTFRQTKRQRCMRIHVQLQKLLLIFHNRVSGFWKYVEISKKQGWICITEACKHTSFATQSNTFLLEPFFYKKY